jgi:hypothetical protein
MGLGIIILGLALFIGAHVCVAMRERRAAAVARLGEGPYPLGYWFHPYIIGVPAFPR